jgi:hypothetical protein
MKRNAEKQRYTRYFTQLVGFDPLPSVSVMFSSFRVARDDGFSRNQSGYPVFRLRLKNLKSVPITTAMTLIQVQIRAMSPASSFMNFIGPNEKCWSSRQTPNRFRSWSWSVDAISRCPWRLFPVVPRDRSYPYSASPVAIGHPEELHQQEQFCVLVYCFVLFKLVYRSFSTYFVGLINETYLIQLF